MYTFGGVVTKNFELVEMQKIYFEKTYHENENLPKTKLSSKKKKNISIVKVIDSIKLSWQESIYYNKKFLD